LDIKITEIINNQQQLHDPRAPPSIIYREADWPRHNFPFQFNNTEILLATLWEQALSKTHLGQRWETFTSSKHRSSLFIWTIPCSAFHVLMKHYYIVVV